MKFIILRGEQSISDIADKAYKVQSVTERKQVESALLRANPGLKSIKNIRKGALIRIPKIRDARIKDRRSVVDPKDSIADGFTDNLQRFERHFEERFSQLESQHQAALKAIQAGSKDIKKHPNGAEISKNLKKYIKDTATDIEKNRQQGLEAISELMATAKKFDL